MNIQDLMLRSVLLRLTEKLDGDHRGDGPVEPKIIFIDDRNVELAELSYRCQHGKWPMFPDKLVSRCGIEHCVMHMDYEDPDDLTVQFVVDQKPKPSLADAFRIGKKKGWFKGAGSYA